MTVTEPTAPTVDCDDRTGQAPSVIDRWCAVAREVLIGEGIGTGRLDLAAVDEPDMAELNATHLGATGPTDVLAFPLDGPEVAARVDPVTDAAAVGDGPPLHLGDVVLCPAVAARQAPDHAGSFEAEMVLLITHGVLHVLGHDHAEPAETTTMQARERHHLARYGYRHPADRR